jgi:hypothetical protein
MLKNPYEVIVEIGKNSIETNRKKNEFIHTQTDSLVTWLVGFAFTALCLTVTNIEWIKTNLQNTAKPIILCFSLTIFLGLAYRYVSYLITMFQKNVEDNYLAFAYNDLEMTPIQVDDEIIVCDYDNIASNYDNIVKRLKIDFNENKFENLILTEEQKLIELPKLIEHYKNLCDFSKKQFDIGVELFAEINEIAYKVDKKNITKNLNGGLLKQNIGYNLTKWQLLRGWIYFLCILSFVIAVLIVTIYLLKY